MKSLKGVNKQPYSHPLSARIFREGINIMKALKGVNKQPYSHPLLARIFREGINIMKALKGVNKQPYSHSLIARLVREGINFYFVDVYFHAACRFQIHLCQKIRTKNQDLETEIQL